MARPRPNKSSSSTFPAIAAFAITAGIIGYAFFALSKRVKHTRALRRRLPRAATGQPPSHLRTSILGSSKQMIQSVFGPPRSAAGLTTVPGPQSSHYWHADVWYYALDPARKLAMAIRFADGLASEVDFIPAP
jgi:hypothetical protein